MGGMVTMEKRKRGGRKRRGAQPCVLHGITKVWQVTCIAGILTIYNIGTD